jgi:hypothetical protein
MSYESSYRLYLGPAPPASEYPNQIFRLLTGALPETLPNPSLICRQILDTEMIGVLSSSVRKLIDETLDSKYLKW